MTHLINGKKTILKIIVKVFTIQVHKNKNQMLRFDFVKIKIHFKKFQTMGTLLIN